MTPGARAGSRHTAPARLPPRHDRAGVVNREGSVPLTAAFDASDEVRGLTPSHGPARVRLRFEPDGADVRVPNGTPIFDAASWNGVAIDSTCGGPRTWKKCQVPVDDG